MSSVSVKAFKFENGGDFEEEYEPEADDKEMLECFDKLRKISAIKEFKYAELSNEGDSSTCKDLSIEEYIPENDDCDMKDCFEKLSKILCSRKDLHNYREKDRTLFSINKLLKVNECSSYHMDNKSSLTRQYENNSQGSSKDVQSKITRSCISDVQIQEKNAFQHKEKPLESFKEKVTQHPSLDQKDEDDKEEFGCRCGLWFSSKMSIRRHWVNKGHPKGFVCKSCKRICMTIQNMREHRNSVHKNLRPYICSDCGKAYKRKSNLRQHWKYEHSTVKDFVCGICSRWFAQKPSLENHMERHIKPLVFNKYSCQCGLLFSTEYDLNEHCTKEGHSKGYGCKMCKSVYTSCVGLRLHERSVHEGLKHTCHDCGKTFTRRKTLRDHLKHFHLNLVGHYPCPICSRSTTTKSGLALHLQTHSTERPYKCSHCARAFKLRTTLRKHMKTHFVQTLYKCHICFKQYKQLKTFQAHEMTHSGKTPFKCEVCNKVYQSLSSVTNHMQIHINEKAYKCDKCPKTFHLRRSFKHHMTMHDSESKFPCSLCTRIFNVNSQLTFHMKAHYQPYSCDICPKTFLKKSYLDSHAFVHSKERSFECKICQKRFHSPGVLQKHEKRHSSKWGFKCDFCFKVLRDKTTLQAHMKTIHLKNI